MPRSKIALFAMTLGAAPLAAQGLEDALVQKIEAGIERQMERQSLVGLTVAIGVDGGLAWTKGFGMADLEHEVPATEQTVYRLASISKPITAAAVMLLVERGKIELDATVDTYVAAWPQKRWPVTVRQLLAHQGGVRHYLETDDRCNTKVYPTAAAALERFAADPLVFEPGTKYGYSTYGYNLLGAVVEGASGVPFVEFVEANVLAASGVAALQDDSQSRIIRHRARGYRRVGSEIRNSLLVDTSYKAPGGGYCGTAADLVQFANSLHAGKIVSRATLDLMWTAQPTASGTPTRYGYGWFVGGGGGDKIVRHTGSQAGARSSLVCFVDRRLVIAAMCNSEWCDLRRIAIPIARLVVDSAR
ncbi:MAG: beta-lactamase family protein [bacterium]|nr:beta-lactamase family protein [bacterium]